MNLTALTAISPIDGRYRSKTEPLAAYFSEYALIKYRIRVEIEYFIALCELPLPQLADFDHSLYESLRDIYRNFSVEDAQRVKDIEKVTNHDVKAVEYFIKERIDTLRPVNGGNAAVPFKEFIHFGLTSQDINNTSVPLSIKEAHFAVKITDVIGFICPNTQGALAVVLKELSAKGIFIEYMYSFANGDVAHVVIRPTDLDACDKVLADMKVDLIAANDLYQL